jgi:hypothetical protein
MAKTIEQLQEELGKVSAQTRRAYDALNSKERDGRFYVGLYRRLDIAQNTLKKKGLFESARIEAEETIAELEPKIKEAEAEYKKFQEQKNALNKELKAIKTAEQEKKTKAAVAKGAANVYTDAIEELNKADLGLEGYKGNEKYIAAYTKAREAYNTLTESGVTPKVVLPQPKIAIPEPEEETKLGPDGKPIKEPNITEFINTITDPKNKAQLIDVQKDLAANFGYKGPVDGSPSTNFIASLNDAFVIRGRLPKAWQGADFRTFLASPDVAGTAGKGTGTGDGSRYDPYGTLAVWDKTKTKAELTTLFDNLGLDRDPTDKEINNIFAKLDKKQKEQKATVTKYKMINGVRTAVTTPGFNQAEFVTDLVKNTKEYKDIVAKKATQEESKILTSAQTLRNVADKNGITLDQDQLDSFTDRIKKGEDVTLLANDIRKLAAIGQPDNIKKLIEQGVDLATVYDPYKKLMSSVLEVNPNSIPLNDPTLRMAIGPDKEMSLYEYQRELRKDNRWQYTNQARTEASDAARTVLKDFGFMG